MKDTRRKDGNWLIRENSEGRLEWSQVTVAVLMDIRDELKAMNVKLNRLNCPDFIAIPRILGTIRRNTTKRRRVRKVTQR